MAETRAPAEGERTAAFEAMLKARDHVGTTLAMAAGGGNLEAVKYLVEVAGVDPNATKKKGGNSALHASLAQNRVEVAEYLIGKGVDVNARNMRGQTPLMLAVSCCHGLRPVELLLAAGARASTKSWRYKQDSLEIARIKGFKSAVPLLEKAIEAEAASARDSKEGEQETLPRGRTKCPICGELIRAKPRINFLISNHEREVEKATQASNAESSEQAQQQQDQVQDQEQDHQQQQQQQDQGDARAQVETPTADDATTDLAAKQLEAAALTSKAETPEEPNRYVGEFLQSKAFAALKSNPKYHTLADKHHLRKEVTETWAILEAVRAQCTRLDIDIDTITLVDLCSGKSLTSALFGLEHPRSRVIAVDRMPANIVPHFDENVSYIQADIMRPEFAQLLADRIQQCNTNPRDSADAGSDVGHPDAGDGDSSDGAPQRESTPRPAILVGMHLCGVLSLRAIELFKAIPAFRGIVLSPCCFPTRRSGVMTVRDSGFTDELDKYEFWTRHLHTAVAASAASCDTFKNPLIFSNRNNIISATR
ncbi:hypothetical protein PTSG_02474 [Salpingoeca rosetta]|uniref:Methyltransferase domain-containing protein n=1 Tax=Salpingoeca rosetta (strain ATCC 50818 / BSB-021) TaxID=946362 RepID=F2U2A9_SALR5|nr:uncharacterized protein PTSG_02474 [Salpingoeca rosetta]EGD81761.1 hypothetical protein PTSG_02474 [Salpingoeca rosetta]|eukprot:XP_004996965.1 hypothetical protein PTSG_02474 [Salpingoeca rosetta]